MTSFFQTGPELHNQYTSDRVLQLYLKTYMPKDLFEFVQTDSEKFAARACSELENLVIQAEANPPTLKQFDSWGRRIDKIEVHSAWETFDRIAAEEGLVAIGYERKLAEFSRLYQFTKLYIFHPSSAYYSCPLAMTDGAAKLIEIYGSEDLKKDAFRNLTSRNPKTFWTSGQWMTEKSGGSDISGTETHALPAGDHFNLSGVKWFTSATTAQMAMTLATTPNAKGLSLFYLELRKPDGSLNGIEILRLKNKLGTKALPTAELKLVGAEAQMVGEPGRGVKQMAALFNISRWHNAISAVSTQRRVIALLHDYSNKRVAFGKKINDLPLHQATLANMQADFTGSFVMVGYLTRLLGLLECSDEDTKSIEKRIRALTPLTKFFTARLCRDVVTEAVEGFGGAGYIEDVGMARHYRDAIVLSIWEGTTNVLSLDFERSILKDNIWPDVLSDVDRLIDSIKDSSLSTLAEKLSQEWEDVQVFAKKMFASDNTGRDIYMYDFANAMAIIYVRALLLDFANRTKSPEIRAVCENWQFRYPANTFIHNSAKRQQTLEILGSLT